jgi:hypothetical protein
VETDSGLHINEGLFVSIAFAYHDPFQADWIGDEAIKVLLNDYLERMHTFIVYPTTPGEDYFQ